MTARLKHISLTIFQRFFQTETVGGLVLLAFGLAALAMRFAVGIIVGSLLAGVAGAVLLKMSPVLRDDQ
jgi:Na+/H+ antiporter NhaA